MCKEDGTILFLLVPNYQEKRQLTEVLSEHQDVLRMHLFTVWMAEHWHRLPRGAVECCPWRSSKSVEHSPGQPTLDGSV